MKYVTSGDWFADIGSDVWCILSCGYFPFMHESLYTGRYKFIVLHIRYELLGECILIKMKCWTDNEWAAQIIFTSSPGREGFHLVSA